MKTRHIVGVFTAVGLLLAALSGCSLNDPNSQSSLTNSFNSFSESKSDYNSSAGSGESGLSENNTPHAPNSAERAVKVYEKTIDTDGILLDLTEEEKKLYFHTMDDDHLYFRSLGFPSTVSSFNRETRSKSDIMSYTPQIEVTLWYNKYTYCGRFFAFPCLSDREEGDNGGFYITGIVGSDGERSKRILHKEVGLVSVYASELNDTEMVFTCVNPDRKTEELYKYKVGNEQADLIHAETLARDCNLVDCCNNEIYLINHSNDSKTAFVVKRLDSNGSEIAKDLLELPQYADMQVNDFTVTENNYIIRFKSNDPKDGQYHPVLVDRKSKNIIWDFSDYGLGIRFNDSVIDGRYVIFYHGKDESCAQICVFDDKETAFHLLTFKGMSDFMIYNTAADYKGDIIFATIDDYDEADINDKDKVYNRSLVLYKDIISLL